MRPLVQIVRLLALPFLFALGLAASCNSQGGASNPDPATDLATPPQIDAGDLGSPPDQAKPSSVAFLKQIPSSTNVDIVRQVGVDSSGNVFLGCMFSATVNFGDGPRTTQGNHDVAVVKLGPKGDLIWVRQFGSSEADSVLRLAVDPDGSVVITGIFTGTLDFGAGPVISHGKEDLYLVKYAADGRLVFGKAIGTVDFEASYAGLAVDANHNVYLAGAFGIGSSSGVPIDLGGGPLTSRGYSDGFVVKFDAVGDHVFSKRFGGKYLDYIMDLALAKDGDIVIGGKLGGTVDLGTGPLMPPTEATSWAFIARLSSAGSPKWVASYFNDGSTAAQLAVSDSGITHVAGSFVRSLQTRTASLSSGNNSNHGFLLQLDATGKEGWARAVAPASETDYVETLSTDGESIYLGGLFNGSADFGLGMRTAPKTDAFVVRYSLTGMPSSMRQYGGSSFTCINSVAARSDALYIGGFFQESVRFEDTTLTATGQSDGVLLKLLPTLAPALQAPR